MSLSPNGRSAFTVSAETWRVAELATLRALVAPLERLARLVVVWRSAANHASLLRLATTTPPTDQRLADDAEERARYNVFLYLDVLLRRRRHSGVLEPSGDTPVKTVVADPTVSRRRLMRYGVEPERVIRDVALAMGAVSRDPTLADTQKHDVINVLAWYQNDAELLGQGNTEVTMFSTKEES